jgi:hypothetical protein
VELGDTLSNPFTRAMPGAVVTISIILGITPFELKSSASATDALHGPQFNQVHRSWPQRV